jgi:hypothetical protein
VASRGLGEKRRAFDELAFLSARPHLGAEPRTTMTTRKLTSAWTTDARGSLI